jgi:hypothetical protein
MVIAGNVRSGLTETILSPHFDPTLFNFFVPALRVSPAVSACLHEMRKLKDIFCKEIFVMRRSIPISIVIFLSMLMAVQAAEFYTKDKVNERRGEPTEEMALVYVFRPASAGGMIKTWAFVDDQLIGVSKAKAYSFALVPEGTHIFWSKAENTSAIEMEVKAGETYYFKQSIRPGLNKARVKLVQINEAEVGKYFKKCRYVEPTDEGIRRGGEIAANRLERAKKKVTKKRG